MKKIGIFGFGYVGRAFYNFFKNHFKVFAYDILESVQKKYNLEKSTDFINDMDLILICVPTNKIKSLPNKTGSVDLSNIESCLKLIKNKKLILIKSTIPPLTTKNLSKKYPHLRICFSPEYIGESSYYLPAPYDFDKEVVKTPYFIFGGDSKDCNKLIQYFKVIAGPTKEYIQTTSLNAEICKYMENAFFATKIVFCNEFEKICESFGGDYNVVRELWLKDSRITKTHTLIMNEEDSKCFSGKCLPKDLSGIITHSKYNGYKARFLESVEYANKNLRLDSKKPHILMIHRIHFNNKISPLYFDRNMAISLYKLESIIDFYLNNGFSFGDLEECLSDNKKFCLSFDDGYKEHLKIAKILFKKYNIPKKSMIFCININNSLHNIFCNMDLIYALIDNNRMQDLCEYFSISKEFSVFDIINMIKKDYMNLDSKSMQDFYEKFKLDLSSHFLDSKDIKELNKIASIASHSVFHRNLTKHINNSKIEIIESKKILESIINEKINIFCYPEGKSDESVWNLCKKAAFSYALSINHKENNPFCIGRKDIAKL